MDFTSIVWQPMTQPVQWSMEDNILQIAVHNIVKENIMIIEISEGETLYYVNGYQAERNGDNTVTQEFIRVHAICSTHAEAVTHLQHLDVVGKLNDEEFEGLVIQAFPGHTFTHTSSIDLSKGLVS